MSKDVKIHPSTLSDLDGNPRMWAAWDKAIAAKAAAASKTIH